MYDIHLDLIILRTSDFILAQFDKVMKRFTFFLIAAVVLLANCHARQIYFELSNDPEYPQLISVSNVQYSITSNRNIDLSATVTIHEDIDEGTNVSVIENMSFELQITRICWM